MATSGRARHCATYCMKLQRAAASRTKAHDLLSLKTKLSLLWMSFHTWQQPASQDREPSLAIACCDDGELCIAIWHCV
jgi:hypothetical protein